MRVKVVSEQQRMQSRWEPLTTMTNKVHVIAFKPTVKFRLASTSSYFLRAPYFFTTKIPAIKLLF